MTESSSGLVGLRKYLEASQGYRISGTLIERENARKLVRVTECWEARQGWSGRENTRKLVRAIECPEAR